MKTGKKDRAVYAFLGKPNQEGKTFVFGNRNDCTDGLSSLVTAGVSFDGEILTDMRGQSKIVCGALLTAVIGIVALEKQCDAEIEAIATELDQILRKHGGDLSLPQTMYDTYVGEKNLVYH